MHKFKVGDRLIGGSSNCEVLQTSNSSYFLVFGDGSRGWHIAERIDARWEREKANPSGKEELAYLNALNSLD